jgi:hypothetical protein
MFLSLRVPGPEPRGEIRKLHARRHSIQQLLGYGVMLLCYPT